MGPLRRLDAELLALGARPFIGTLDQSAANLGGEQAHELGVVEGGNHGGVGGTGELGEEGAAEGQIVAETTDRTVEGGLEGGLEGGAEEGVVEGDGHDVAPHTFNSSAPCVSAEKATCGSRMDAEGT